MLVRHKAEAKTVQYQPKRLTRAFISVGKDNLIVCIDAKKQRTREKQQLNAALPGFSLASGRI
ncbi:MAG: hypothetical protein ACQES4_00010 [Bacillota bacterium]